MKLWESPLRTLRTAALLSWALAVAVFFNATGNEFAYDDNLIVLENTGIQSLETLPKALLEPYWPGRYGEGLGLWRPVVTGLLGGEWALFDGNPVGFHVVNVLLHSGVTVLVVLLLGEILPVAGAFLGGLLFAVHPVHVEAVANVVGVAELLAAFFFLWASLLIIRGGVRMGAGRVVAVILLYALAFLTKESAITLLGIVLLLDTSREDLGLKGLASYLRQRWVLYAGMLGTASLILYGRHLVLGSLADPYAPLGASILKEVPRIWTVAATWPHVIRLLFFPLELSVDYGPAVIPIAYGWNLSNLAGVFLVIGILCLALVAWRKGPLGPERLSSRTMGWGVVWFVVTLSPTTNILFLSGILLSERTLYLPSVGFVAAAGWALLRLWTVRPRLAPLLLSAALVLMGVRTWTRTPTWKNNLEVFQTLTSDHPEAGRSQWILGDSYFAIGQVKEGLRAYRVAIGILGGHYNLMVGVSRNLIGAGYDDAAALLLRYAWEQRPEFGVAPGLLAGIYDRKGLYPEAEEAARYSLGKDSTDAIQHHTLSRALQAQGRWTEAIAERKAAIRMGESEHLQQWVWLAEIQLQVGDTVQARASLDSARLRAVPAGNAANWTAFSCLSGWGRNEESGSVNLQRFRRIQYQGRLRPGSSGALETGVSQFGGNILCRIMAIWELLLHPLLSGHEPSLQSDFNRRNYNAGPEGFYSHRAVDRRGHHRDPGCHRHPEVLRNP